MTRPQVLCWIAVNATPYHVERLSAAARRLCLVQLAEIDDFPILRAQQGAADDFNRRTLYPRTPASQIEGRTEISLECMPRRVAPVRSLHQWLVVWGHLGVELVPIAEFR
jgi:hypothetical protein